MSIYDEASLVMPAFSLAEPYETLVRRGKSRKQLVENLKPQIKEMCRSKPYSENKAVFDSITNLFVQSVKEEEERLRRTIERILKVAEIIPITSEILTAALEVQTTKSLSPQDSIVYASVIKHLEISNAVKKCFLNRNSKDFDDPDVVDTLESYGCKMLFKFTDGYNYIRSQIT